MNYTFTSDLSKKEFENFAQNHLLGSFFQTKSWAGVKNNWESIYTGVYNNKELVGACLVLKRDLVLKYSFMYAPRGPLIDFNNKDLLQFYLENLVNLAKVNKAIAFTIDPYVIRGQYSMQKAMKNNVDVIYNDSIIPQFEKFNFNHTGFSKDMHDTIQPRFQPAIYLDDKNIEIYNKSRGFKNGLKGQSNNVTALRLNAEGLEEFLTVIEKTEEAKNISLRGKAYFEKLLSQFKDDCLISIAYLNLEAELKDLKYRSEDLEKRLENKTIKAGRRKEYESQLKSVNNEIIYIKAKIKEHGPKVNIAGLLALKNNSKAEFLYAGMDRDFLKYYGSNVNYIDTIAWAQESGCNLLSFGGSSGHFNEGIDRFKATFDPTLDEFIGEFVFENKKMLNNLFILAQKIRKKIIHRTH